MDPASAERAMLRVCRSGLDVTDLQHQVLAALRAAMTIDAAFFATADPETLLFTGAHSEDPLIAVAPMFLDNELGGRDVNTFTGLARAPGHVASLDTATHSERVASTRYRDIMRPVGLGDELRAALMVDGHCWGYLCLHREDGEPACWNCDGTATVTSRARVEGGEPPALHPRPVVFSW